jgi:signal transduction histidine kinase
VVASSFPFGGRLSWPLRAVRVAGLVVLVVILVRSAPSPGWTGLPLLLTVLLTASSIGWLLWLGSDRLSPRGRVAALLVIGIPGALLTGLSPAGVAIVLPAVALVDAGARLPHRHMLAITVSVLAAASVGHAFTSWSGSLTNAVVLVACALVGTLRWQYVQRAEQSELLLSSMQVAAEEHARAATLAERSRVARELHDLQAHALAALSVQLKVIDALVEDRADAEEIRGHVSKADELTRAGLVETRRAILALREEVLPLGDLLASLAEGYSDRTGRPADLTINGEPRSLPTDVTVSLYRTAQEALTNVRRHAENSPVTIALVYRADAVCLTVENELPGASPGRPTAAAGYGLAGIAERAQAVGGTSTAGPDGPRWRVAVRMPV